MTDPIRCFVATDWMAGRAERALEYSARKNCSEPDRLQFFWMRAGDPGFTGWKGQPDKPYTSNPQTWGTCFTKFRYAVPALCGFDGFACYFDVDQLILGDLVEFWNMRKAGKWLVASGDSVALVDCGMVKGDKRFRLDELRRAPDPKGKMRGAVAQEKTLPKSWNHFDKCNDETKLIHYTDMRMQPWRGWDHLPYREHHCQRSRETWFAYDKEAAECGFEISQTPWPCSPTGESSSLETTPPF